MDALASCPFRGDEFKYGLPHAGNLSSPRRVLQEHTHRFASPSDGKISLKLLTLWCVTDITAYTHDKKVIFTACSDAPHKRSFRKKVIQRTDAVVAPSKRETPGSTTETLD